eukprot:scaffold636_cov252-Pinguiococcus_pyrenoidosus.AAC.9
MISWMRKCDGSRAHVLRRPTCGTHGLLRLVRGKLLSRMDNEEAKNRAAMLRVYYAQIENLERKYPADPAPIDWAAFKATVQTPGVVEGSFV